MPYSTFIHVLDWKSKLEEERKKKFDEKVRSLKPSKNRAPAEISKNIKKRGR